jgi:hypothetical protein
VKKVELLEMHGDHEEPRPRLQGARRRGEMDQQSAFSLDKTEKHHHVKNDGGRILFRASPPPAFFFFEKLPTKKQYLPHSHPF